MKNILDVAVKEEILQRIAQLHAGTVPLWGSMNCAQTLKHVSLALMIPLGALDPTPPTLPPLPKWLLKYFLLNKQPPKGLPTFLEMDLANGLTAVDFESESRLLTETIEKFCAADSFIPENKVAGKFSKEDWGRLHYNHTDHHLRQFGV